MRLGDLDNSMVFGTRPVFISPSRRRVSLIVRALLLIRSHSDARPINSHVLPKVNRGVLLLKTEKADFFEYSRFENASGYIILVRSVDISVRIQKEPCPPQFWRRPQCGSIGSIGAIVSSRLVWLSRKTFRI